MRTKITHRKDGRVVVEVRGETEYFRGQAYQPDDCRIEIYGKDGYCREIAMGDEGVLAEKGHVSKPGYEQAYLYDDPEGIGGNTNPKIQRLHGWRGTTNGIIVTAHGWRRVEEYRPVTRGYGVRCVLSVDLKPQAD